MHISLYLKYLTFCKVRIEEILEDEKPTDENGASKKPKKKKNQSNGIEDSKRQIVMEGNTNSSLLESEDEDGFPISAPCENKAKSVTLKKSHGTKYQDTSEEAPNEKSKDKDDENKGLKKRLRDDTSKADDHQRWEPFYFVESIVNFEIRLRIYCLMVMT